MAFYSPARVLPKSGLEKLRHVITKSVWADDCANNVLMEDRRTAS